MKPYVSDRALLRQAWPEGYLAKAGVQTVEGWIFSSNCLVFSEDGLHKRNVSPRSSCVIHKPGTNNREVQAWIDAGDLLPNVNPLDRSTWAHLLYDLIDACWSEAQPRPKHWQITGWRPALVPAVPNPSAGRAGDWQAGWVLEYSAGIMGVVNCHFAFPIALSDIAGSDAELAESGADLENGAALALVHARIQPEGGMSVDDRDLLWKAWPDGYLAKRGVQTIAGWQCVGFTEPDGLTRWLSPSDQIAGINSSQGMFVIRGLRDGGPPYERRATWRDDMDTFRMCADLGELLPNVDPADTATWQCLLKELAGGGPPGHPGFLWTPGTDHDRPCWRLTISADRLLTNQIFHIDNPDPGEALVLARIQRRQEAT